MARGALEVEREGEQCRFGKASTDELESNRKAAGRETGRDRDRRKSCVGGQRRVAARLSAADDRRDSANRRIGDRVKAARAPSHRGRLGQCLPCGKTALVVLAREIVAGRPIRHIEDALNS